MRTNLIGKPKNWLDGLYKGVKPYENIEIIKKEDFIPKTPTRLMSKNQMTEAIKSMRESIKPSGKATWLTVNGMYEIDYNYNPPRVIKIKEKE